MSDALDLSFLNGTPEQRAATCTALLNTLKKRGVAKLKNHGLPTGLINELFEYSRRFFALPLEDKMIAKHPPQSTPNRGYSYVGQESVSNISGFEKGLAQGEFVRDIKETLDLGSPQDTLVDNLWIPEDKLPGFRQFMETFYTRAFEVQNNILAALAEALKIPVDRLLALHAQAENEMRLLHYPPTAVSEMHDGKATRIAEHTDFGTITMLFQDSTGGLQVEDQTQPGVFHGVESSDKTEIILNIGDSLQRLTNDTFRAACHRVTYPPTVRIGADEIMPERYSIAYFVKPNRKGSLLPFPEFVKNGTPCKYSDITAWDYNNLRIQKLYAAN